MISIRFLRGRLGEGTPSADLSTRGGASIAVAPADIPSTSSLRTLLDSLEPDRVAVDGLPDPPLGRQEVDVTEHLGEGEEGLGHGDVAPQLLGDLVRRARALGNQPVDLLGPPAVHREALVDQPAMVGDRLAVPREHDLRRQLSGASGRLYVDHQRPWALV